ncbi:MAG: hypothetical protein KJ771_07675 [Nanoarchaeota archaeon]|nr:hypothetical protein [Nanoarchaeota archaeon]
MAKKKSVVKKIVLKPSKKSGKISRGPSGKPKHSKVAKMVKLAKARSKKSKAKKVVSKKKKR